MDWELPVYDFDGVAPDEKAYSINYGRPNYGALFKSIAGEGNMPNATSPSVACMVCGPAAMVDEVSNICFEYNFYFQAEEFHFWEERLLSWRAHEMVVQVWH